MLEDKIQKIKFNNSSPIEIFCDQQLDSEYYLRGRVLEFKDYIYNPNDEDITLIAIYNFAIIVLVNDKYQKRIRKLDEQDTRYFIFEGNTEKDYLKCKKKFYKKNPKIFQEVMRYATALGGIDKYENPNCLISLEEIEPLKRKYRKYLEKSEKLAKNSIVLGMDIYKKDLHQDKKLYPESIFLLPVLHFSKKRNVLQDFDKLEPDELEFDLFLDDLVEHLHNDLEYDEQNYMDSEIYHKILKDIGDIGFKSITKRRISRKLIDSLKPFKQSIGDRADPVTDFCYKFFDDLEDYLKSKKRIRQCPLCNSYYRYKRKSMYCEECSNQKGENPEMNAYNEIQRILREYEISQDMPLEDIYHLFSKLISKKEVMIALLRDRLIRENPEKNKYDIYEELADKLNISVSMITHAKY